MQDFQKKRIEDLRGIVERGFGKELDDDQQIIVDLAYELNKIQGEANVKRTVASLCAADVGKKVRFSGDEVWFVGHVVSFEVPEPYERLAGSMASSADRVNITLRRLSSVGVVEHPIIMELTDSMEVE